MSNSVRPHRGQPTRLSRPWDSPGKNTGVGCHFLLQCKKVKSESEVAQSCLTLSDPMDCSLPGSNPSLFFIIFPLSRAFKFVLALNTGSQYFLLSRILFGFRECIVPHCINVYGQRNTGDMMASLVLSYNLMHSSDS